MSCTAPLSQLFVWIGRDMVPADSVDYLDTEREILHFSSVEIDKNLLCSVQHHKQTNRKQIKSILHFLSNDNMNRKMKNKYKRVFLLGLNLCKQSWVNRF